MSELARLVGLGLAGVVGGGLNSVAGGGSFIVFPTLLLTGVPPVAANATTSVALWPAGVASAGAYRHDLPRSRATLWTLGAASAAGGGLGGLLLLGTSDTTFAHVLPWLMLTAASIFTFGRRLSARTGAGRHSLLLGALVQLVISTYGGYFGGGMGIMMLASFTVMGMREIHEMNALKVILGTLINGVAIVAFFVAGKVVLGPAAAVGVGSIAGGFFGASLAKRVDPKWVRGIVLVVAWGMTAWFFVRDLR